MADKVVDFAAPFRPNRQKISPFGMENDKFSIATTGLLLPNTPKALVEYSFRI